MSKSGVNQCMARLGVAYPHHFKQADLDADFALQVYHEILDDVDDGLLMAATKQWLSSAHPFHPSPGELRDLALRMVEHDELSADEAWAEVLAAVRFVGSYGVPVWSNDTITKTMQAFGRWKDFCLTEDDQMTFARAQFMKIYAAQQARRHDDRLMLPEVSDVIARLAESKRLQLRSGE
jgi:hypothetical protein